jgi:hypothetical protein
VRICKSLDWVKAEEDEDWDIVIMKKKYEGVLFNDERIPSHLKTRAHTQQRIDEMREWSGRLTRRRDHINANKPWCAKGMPRGRDDRINTTYAKTPHQNRVYQKQRETIKSRATSWSRCDQ